MISPYKGKYRVSQIYKGSAHKGLDLVGLDDKTIRWPLRAGEVEVVRWDSHPTGGMGLYARIRDLDTGYLHYFAHLSEVAVKSGQMIHKGDVIGMEGSTGHSTGSHLHWEVRRTSDNTSYLDISKIAGIPNRLGEYESEVVEMTKTEAKKIVQEAAGLDDNTMRYLDMYRYAESLLIKLAEAIEGR